MREANRCLVCQAMCSLCVTVCPNRANQMYQSDPVKVDMPTLCVDGGELVVTGTVPYRCQQRIQVINIADFCNECGNCTTFCPTSGAPYREKPRVCLNKDSFDRATHDAYYLQRREEGTDVLARITDIEHALEIRAYGVVYRGQGVFVVFDSALAFREATAVEDLDDGTEVDLTVVAKMFVVARALETLPQS